MTVNWQNPYAVTRGKWFRGNLHAHCISGSPCAVITLDSLLDGYLDAGYDFLSVSDHLAVTLPHKPGLNILPGTEWNSRPGYMANLTQTQHDHVGIYSLDAERVKSSLKFRTLADLLESPDATSLYIANHPDWLLDEHYDFATLLEFSSQLDGIEIYNHSIVSEPGRADSTWKWDRLLTKGNRLLGFCHDDSHKDEDIGNGWLMVKAEENTPKHIFEALKSGNFYCSTGITILELERHHTKIYVSIKDEAAIRVIGNGGSLLAETVGTSFEWDFRNANTLYARFHIRDSSWRQGWSQPFFIDEIEEL